MLNVEVFSRYFFALLITLVVLFFRTSIPPLGEITPYLLFIFPIIISSYFYGFFPGAFATIVSALLIDYYITPPIHQVSLDLVGIFRSLIFIAQGIITSYFIDSIVRDRNREFHQRQWFETTLSSIGDAVIATDNQGRIVFMNQIAEKLTGWKFKRACGVHLTRVFNIINEKTRQKTFNPIEKVLKEKRIIELSNHTILIHQKGYEIPIDDSAAPIKNINGHIVGVILVFRDIAEKKKAQKELIKADEKIRKIFESVTDGVAVIDRYWRFKYINDQAAQIIGLPKPDILGRTVFKIVPDFKNTSLYKTFLKTRKEKTPNIVEFYYKPHDCWYESRLFPMDDGITVYFHDVTQRKLLENKKDEFMSIASHELKTPLTSIKGYVQILERLINDLGHEKAKLFITKTNMYIDRLNDLITDLLDVSKIQAGKLQLNIARFDVCDLIKESIDGIQLITDKHKINMTNEMHEMVVGDKHRLEQVLNNLLSNAIKYSPYADKVNISVNKEGNNIRISVRDFGIGISTNNLDKVFSRFYRVESAASKFSGLGIGLYISREIIRRHKGKIWVESKLGKGTTFHFTLPIQT